MLKSYLVISSKILVRVFRQCTFARYVLNGHNYFCLQDNEIRCCEVKPREKNNGGQTFFEVAKLHFISNLYEIFLSLTEPVETGGQGGGIFASLILTDLKSKPVHHKTLDTGAVAPHSFEIS